jgi:predicted alpha/beta hydrolase
MLAGKSCSHFVLADDGYKLAATSFQIPDQSSVQRVAVINAGAGIPAGYYHKFAAWLAGRGVPTTTYDYRGVGKSRFGPLKGFQASVEDWGSKDCAAIFRYVRTTFPEASIAVIGHSIGSFLTGFVTDPRRIDLLAFIGGHTGYFGDYRLRSRIQMGLLWHVLMPAISRKFGYFPGRRFGLPEDLPLGVALEWGARRKPDFRWNINLRDGTPDHSRRREISARFSAFRGKGLLIRTTDDAFVTSSASSRIQGLFTNVAFDEKVIDPNLKGIAKVGHFGFFRSQNERTLWNIVGDWIVLSDTSGPSNSS